MPVEIYQGKNVIAETTLNYIDSTTINEGIKKLEEIAEELLSISKKIEKTKDLCNRESLSVGNNTLEAIIDSCETEFIEVSNYLNDSSKLLLEALQKAIDKKQILLNDEAIKLDSLESIQ